MYLSNYFTRSRYCHCYKKYYQIWEVGGFKTALGTCCALLIHTSAAVLGLSAIIVKSALLFSAFKYVGAVYLIYLGVKTLWSIKKKEEAASVEINKKTRLKAHLVLNKGCLQIS